MLYLKYIDKREFKNIYNNNWQTDLETYICQGEPDKVKKTNAWKAAIGLQDVDGLKTSDYLLDTAKAHIEGKISISDADKRIQRKLILFLLELQRF